MEKVHVTPTNDIILHELKDDECVCGPEIEFKNGKMIIIHHSLDGREVNDKD